MGKGFTVTVNVVVVAHAPGAGVNVYVVVAVLLTAGDQVPLIPLFEVVGNVSNEPLQIGAMGLNCGATMGLTVTVLVAEPEPHVPVPLTVYVVVTAGVATTVAPVVALNPAAGDHV